MRSVTFDPARPVLVRVCPFASCVCVLSGCGLFDTLAAPASSVDAGEADAHGMDVSMGDGGHVDVGADMDVGGDIGPPACVVPAKLLERSDERASLGALYSASPVLEQGAVVRWSKTYGPDDLTVDTETGEITWEIPQGLPTESFHVGLEGVDACGGKVEDVWIVTLGDRAILRVGFDETYKTVREAFAAASFGDTVVLNKGVYQGEANSMDANPTETAQVVSGTPDAFTTVIAEDPGDVFVRHDLHWTAKWRDGISYVAVKGVLFDGVVRLERGNDSAPLPHHIKFVDVGSRARFVVSRSEDILVEGCYAYGGSDYKITVFGSERVIVRRCVTRIDHEGTDGSEGYFGSMVAQSSSNVFFQNSLDIDSDQAEAYPIAGGTGALASRSNSSSNQRIVFDRGIVLNNATKLASYNESSGITEVEFRDIVAWDVQLSGVQPNLIRGVGAGSFDHMTIGSVRVKDGLTGRVDAIFDGVGPRRDELKNSFVSGIRHPMFRDFEAIAYDAFHDVEASTFDGAEHRPDTFVPVGSREQVLVHLPRVVEGSVLDGAASDGEAIGARVMTFVGRSGTFYGEPGWDEETEISMWPFPHEDVIARHFSAYRFDGDLEDGRTISVSGDRGFAQEGGVARDGGPQTLTTYIWEYLGAPCPADVCRGSRER